MIAVAFNIVGAFFAFVIGGWIAAHLPQLQECAGEAGARTAP